MSLDPKSYEKHDQGVLPEPNDSEETLTKKKKKGGQLDYLKYQKDIAEIGAYVHLPGSIHIPS